MNLVNLEIKFPKSFEKKIQSFFYWKYSRILFYLILTAVLLAAGFYIYRLFIDPISSPTNYIIHNNSINSQKIASSTVENYGNFFIGQASSVNQTINVGTPPLKGITTEEQLVNLLNEVDINILPAFKEINVGEELLLHLRGQQTEQINSIKDEVFKKEIADIKWLRTGTNYVTGQAVNETVYSIIKLKKFPK